MNVRILWCSIQMCGFVDQHRLVAMFSFLLRTVECLMVLNIYRRYYVRLSAGNLVILRAANHFSPFLYRTCKLIYYNRPRWLSHHSNITIADVLELLCSLQNMVLNYA
jgi:hypothetical protein